MQSGKFYTLVGRTCFLHLITTQKMKAIRSSETSVTYIYIYIYVKVKIKDKVHPRTGHEGPEGE